MPTPGILATDLDGTLIPWHDHAEHRQALAMLAEQLATHAIPLLFVTGRHLESVLGAIQEFELPTPDTIICDVGSSIYEKAATGQWQLSPGYASKLDEIVGPAKPESLRERFSAIDALRLQEEAKQGRFKLSYYVDQKLLEECHRQVTKIISANDLPYEVIASVDPFNGDGLIDLLPRGVSKAGALDWWMETAGHKKDNVVFAGDSGNDWAALVAGYRAIVVGNADRDLAKKIATKHEEAGWRGRLYLAEGSATVGVLEGCRWFELLAPQTDRLGATPISATHSYFRVWAPKRRKVEVEVENLGGPKRYPLAREEFGYFTGTAPATAGDQYFYVLDDHLSRPDPATRLQPDGVHQRSEIIDHRQFAWTDDRWTGVEKRDLVIYELHVGTFTQQGTFASAIERIDEIRELGATAIEILPVAQSPGRWNWGYDGVQLFSVRNTFGGPEGFKQFVDACHAAGIAVLLDVVYNHLGPEGNYLNEFAPYFSKKHHTPWGDAPNFDDRHSKHVRRFVVENVLEWIQDYHLDGLRFDAVHFMHDASEPSIHAEIRKAVDQAQQRSNRHIHLIGETNVFDPHLLVDENGNRVYDAIWSDCLMHSLYSLGAPDVRLTGRAYIGATDVAEALDYGWLFYSNKYQRVDANGRQALELHLPRDQHLGSLVMALQTHDSVGNHPHGSRLHQLAGKDFQRAAAALLLLYPSIPLLFMGEESASEAPFPFFADFGDQRLRRAVDEGRKNEYSHHSWEGALLPSDEAAFYNAKLSSAADDPAMFKWYQSLLTLRKQGLADGWLSNANLSTRYDAENHIYTLGYQTSEGSSIEIHSRLAVESIRGSSQSPVAIAGKVLLASHADAPDYQPGKLGVGCQALVVLR